MSQFEIVGLLETWSRTKNEFDDFLADYIHFNSIRIKTNASFRNSGGVIVFVGEKHIMNGFIQRLYDYLSDCVVLLIKSSICEVKKDTILYVTYISPEGSLIYRDADVTSQA